MGLAFVEDGLNNIAWVLAHKDDIQTGIHTFWYSIQWQNWIPNSINQIHKAASNAWIVCTSKGRELDVILRSSQLSCEMPLSDNRKWWIEECMLPKFTPVISCPFSCLCPLVYEKSVLKAILLYTYTLFFCANWSLSLIRKEVVSSHDNPTVWQHHSWPGSLGPKPSRAISI